MGPLAPTFAARRLRLPCRQRRLQAPDRPVAVPIFSRGRGEQERSRLNLVHMIFDAAGNRNLENAVIPSILSSPLGVHFSSPGRARELEPGAGGARGGRGGGALGSLVLRPNARPLVFGTERESFRFAKWDRTQGPDFWDRTRNIDTLGTERAPQQARVCPGVGIAVLRGGREEEESHRNTGIFVDE